ncbi:MAG: hypothetical protein KC657_30710 [Myxococcales bacterium]|nr:hypothetical protein [Myxococcales bacterium]
MTGHGAKVAVLAVGLAGLSAACRCDRPGPGSGTRDTPETFDAGAQPLMPRGMLTPQVDAAPPSRGLRDRLEGFRLSSAPVGAAVQIGLLEGDAASPAAGEPGARYFALEALSLLHDPFARARPGFALLTEQRFEVDALPALSAGLADATTAWLGVATAAQARARAGESSDVAQLVTTDADAAALRDAVASLARELRDVVEEARGRGRVVYLLPPR